MRQKLPTTLDFPSESAFNVFMASALYCIVLHCIIFRLYEELFSPGGAAQMGGSFGEEETEGDDESELSAAIHSRLTR